MTPQFAEWKDFFVAEVGASAALAGLMVVAISINLARILAFPQLPMRAAELLLMLTGVLVLASLALVPGQPIALFGAELSAIGAVTFAVTLANQLQSLPPIEGLTPPKKMLRALVSTAATLPLVAGGIQLVLGLDGGLYWVAAGVLISLAAAVWNAWVLLIEIMR